jgi:hypothetical protein
MSKRILAAIVVVVAGGLVLLVMLFISGGSKANKANGTSIPTLSAEGPTYGKGWGVPLVRVGDPWYIPYGKQVIGGTPYSGNAVTDPTYIGQFFLIGEVDKVSSSVSATGGAPSGKRYAAAHFSVENYAPEKTSTTVDPVAGIYAVGSDGSTYPALDGVDLGSSHPLIPPGPRKLSGGQKLQGWLVFLVPDNKAIKEIHVAPEQSYAGQAIWTICGISQPQNC